MFYFLPFVLPSLATSLPQGFPLFLFFAISYFFRAFCADSRDYFVPHFDHLRSYLHPVRSHRQILSYIINALCQLLSFSCFTFRYIVISFLRFSKCHLYISALSTRFRLSDFVQITILYAAFQPRSSIILLYFWRYSHAIQNISNYII